MADDDAPLEVALITTKEQVNKRLKDEKSHQKRFDVFVVFKRVFDDEYFYK